MICWKKNVLEELKAVGYTTYRIKKEKIFGEAMLQKIRSGNLPSWSTLDKICEILDCQPGDLLGFAYNTDHHEGGCENDS